MSGASPFPCAAPCRRPAEFLMDRQILAGCRARPHTGDPARDPATAPRPAAALPSGAVSGPSPSLRTVSATRRRALVAALVLGLTATACGGSEGGEVGAGAPPDENAAGAGAGGLVGGVVKDGGSDGEGEETTTTATEAPPSSETTAPPATSAPTTQRTAPPQTAPPQTSPPQTFQTTTPKATPNTVGADALNGDAQQVYNALNGALGGIALEAGLVSSAQSHSGKMASSGSSAASTNLYAETGFPWASVNEVTAQGSDVASVTNSLVGQVGSFRGYTFMGVGVSTGTNGVFVSVRVGRQ